MGGLDQQGPQRNSRVAPTGNPIGRRRQPFAEQRRSKLVIYTGDYGAAGAVDLYGPAEGLPHAISGHNTFWWWGPGSAPDGSTTIAINLPRDYLLTIFGHVRYEGAGGHPKRSMDRRTGRSNLDLLRSTSELVGGMDAGSPL